MRYSSTKVNRNPYSSQVAEQQGKSQHLETTLRETQTRLKLLNSIFTGMKSSQSVEQVIVYTLEQLHTYFPGLRVAYSTVTGKGQLRVLSAFEPQKMRSLTDQNVDLTVAPEYLKALQSLTPIKVENVNRDHRFVHLAPFLQANGTQAFLSFPVQHSEELIGVLGFDSPTPKRWSEYEIITLQEVAGYLQLAISQIQTKQALQQAKITLAQQQALYRTLAQQIPNGIVILFDHNWHYLFAEGDNLELVGSNGQAMVGKTIWEIFSAEICDQVELLYRAALGGEAQAKEVSYQGQTYQLQIVPVQNQQSDILAGMVLMQTISSPASAEVTLPGTTALLKAVHDSTPTSISVKDRQGRYLLANPAFLNLVDKTATDVIGKTDLEFFRNREQAEDWRANDRQVMKTGEASTYEEIIDSPNGRRVYLSIKSPYRDATGKMIGLISIATDITDRKKIEISLREREQLSRNVVESTADCVKVLTPEGRLLSMNTYGRCVMEIDDFLPFVNQPWLSFWEEPYQKMAQVAIANAQAGKLGRFQGFCPTAKGTPKWWDVVVTPVLDAEGKVKLLLSTSRDITETRRIEAERQKMLEREQIARAEAETANRIKDEFLAILSHELRTPLNPILGWSQLLQAHKFSEEKTQDALATIERNAKLQIQLIEDLLDISRILRGKLNLDLAIVDLVHPIAGAIETVRLAAEAKSIKIETLFETNVDPVRGDSGRLQQIVWNLLSNAVKFTPNGGSITVKLLTATGHCQSSPIPHAEIHVIDTGEGISPEFLPFVFESFRQQDSSTTRRFGGLGLGLAIVRQLVEAHGGTVSVESGGKGQGTTFKVCLPIVPLHHVSVSEPALLNSAGDLQDLRILLVDDDADSLKLLGFILEQEGAIITAAFSATEALELLIHKNFDVLVSDIGMPEMDGYKLLRQVRMLPNGANLKTIAVTAFASESDHQKALAVGYQKHICKPIQPQVLINAIASLNG